MKNKTHATAARLFPIQNSPSAARCPEGRKDGRDDSLLLRQFFSGAFSRFLFRGFFPLKNRPYRP